MKHSSPSLQLDHDHSDRSKISRLNTLHDLPRLLASLRQPTRIQRKQCLVVPLPRIPRCSANGKATIPRAHMHTPLTVSLLRTTCSIRRRANTQGPVNSERGTKRSCFCKNKYKDIIIIQLTHRDCQTTRLPSIAWRSSARHSQNGR